MRDKSYPDDEGIVEGCIKKDPLAWPAFVKKYSRLIAISIDNRLRRSGHVAGRQDIEDIRQNVLSSIWQDKKLESVRYRKDISHWLAIVSGNMAIEHIRKKRASGQADTVSLYDKIDETELAGLFASQEPGPLGRSASDEISKKIEDAVESLSGKEKLTVKLNLMHGKKYTEIADMLNMPTGSVASYLKRAKEKLRHKLRYLQ